MTITQWRVWTVVGASIVVGLGFLIGVVVTAEWGPAMALVAGGAGAALVTILGTRWRVHRPPSDRVAE